jgi:hypothetical protein
MKQETKVLLDKESEVARRHKTRNKSTTRQKSEVARRHETKILPDIKSEVARRHET